MAETNQEKHRETYLAAEEALRALHPEEVAVRTDTVWRPGVGAEEGLLDVPTLGVMTTLAWPSLIFQEPTSPPLGLFPWRLIPSFPLVPMLFALWEEDEEFPAEARVLYDRAAAANLPLQDLRILADLLEEALQSGLCGGGVSSRDHSSRDHFLRAHSSRDHSPLTCLHIRLVPGFLRAGLECLFQEVCQYAQVLQG